MTQTHLASQAHSLHINSKNYNLMTHKPLGCGVKFYHPERWQEVVNLDSPALYVFTDFKEKSPEVIPPDCLVDQAIEIMKGTKVKSLLIIDDDINPSVLGLVSSRDLQSMLTGVTARQQGVNPKDLTVVSVMRSAENLPTIDFKDLSNARVGHIVRLIRDLGVAHLLVIEQVEISEENPTGQIIRGIFSATRISRQLGEDITGDLSAHSIAEINKRLL